MTKDSPVDRPEEAVRRFAAGTACTPDRVVVKLEGPGGLASLCAVEAALARLWPHPAKELIWLTRAGAVSSDILSLSAFAADGALLSEARYDLVVELAPA